MDAAGLLHSFYFQHCRGRTCLCVNGHAIKPFLLSVYFLDGGLLGLIAAVRVIAGVVLDHSEYRLLLLLLSAKERLGSLGSGCVPREIAWNIKEGVGVIGAAAGVMDHLHVLNKGVLGAAKLVEAGVFLVVDQIGLGLNPTGFFLLLDGQLVSHHVAKLIGLTRFGKENWLSADLFLLVELLGEGVPGVEGGHRSEGCAAVLPHHRLSVRVLIRCEERLAAAGEKLFEHLRTGGTASLHVSWVAFRADIQDLINLLLQADESQAHISFVFEHAGNEGLEFSAVDDAGHSVDEALIIDREGFVIIVVV